MIRRSALPEIPDWYDALFPITDWPLYILAARHGAFGYLEETMSLYRLHAGGLYSSKSAEEKLEAMQRFYRIVDAGTGGQYHRAIRSAHSTYFFEWAEEHLKRGEPGPARRCLWRALAGGGIGDGVSWRPFLRMTARVTLAAAMRRRPSPPAVP